MEALILTVIVGGVCGWLASRIMKTSARMGVIAYVVVGIVGSMLGHWLFGVLGLAAYGLLGRLVVAVIGAVVLIWILKVLKIYK